MTAGHGLRSGAVADAAGVNRQTLRYYERRGLLSEPARGPGGHRRYPPEVVDQLHAIKAAQRLGFTLDEIRAMLDPRRRGALPARARAKLSELDRRMADLRATREALAQVVQVGCDSLTECTCPSPVREFLRP